MGRASGFTVAGFKLKAALGAGLALVSLGCQAARWQEMGNSSDTSLDKAFIDLDSITQVGNYRIASFMTVYEKARVNANNIKLDRHTQKTAFDCGQKKFALIATVGFLDGKQVGASPDNPDWKNTFKDVAQNPASQRILATVCNAPLSGAPQANGGNTNPPPAPSTPPKAKASSGSGIVVNKEGYVLTNNHVVKGCKGITVQVPPGQSGTAIIEAVDPKNDLALLKTSQVFPQAANFRSQAKPAKLGETIGVIGYPLIGILSTEPKATFGQINSVAGMLNDYSILQISAPIQGGNSGGPVLDGTGSVVGIVVSQASPALAALTGNFPQNINFAIRGEMAQIFMTAHRVKFTVASQPKKLETDEIAEAGQQVTAFILCNRE